MFVSSDPDMHMCIYIYVHVCAYTRFSSMYIYMYVHARTYQFKRFLGAPECIVNYWWLLAEALGLQKQRSFGEAEGLLRARLMLAQDIEAYSVHLLGRLEGWMNKEHKLQTTQK